MKNGFAPIILLIGLMVVAAISGAYYFGYNHGWEKSTSNTSQTPITADKTVNWKEYINSQLNYSFKYPSNTTVYEGKRASADGVFIDVPNSVQLNLPISCGDGQQDNSLFTVTASKNANLLENFTDKTPTKKITLDGVEGFETINSVGGLAGMYQIGVINNRQYYLIEGEPCFTETSRKILSTFKFTD